MARSAKWESARTGALMQTFDVTGNEAEMREGLENVDVWRNLVHSLSQRVKSEHGLWSNLRRREQEATVAFEDASAAFKHAEAEAEAEAGAAMEGTLGSGGELAGYSSKGGGSSISGHHPWVTSAPLCLDRTKAIPLLMQRNADLKSKTEVKNLVKEGDPGWKGKSSVKLPQAVAHAEYNRWNHERILNNATEPIPEDSEDRTVRGGSK